jgi:hypothetical protein
MFRFETHSPARAVTYSAPRAGAAGDAGGDAGEGDKPPAFDPTKFVDVETFGKTAAKLRGIESTVTDISKRTLSLDTLVEIGLLAKGEDGKYAVKAAAPQKPEPQAGGEPKPDPQVAKLTDELAKVRKALDAKDKEARDNAERAATQAKADAIKTALADAGAVKPSRDYVHLMGVVSAKEGGGYVIASKDKYGNDVETPLADFIKQFLAENPELVKPQGQAGSGTPQGGGPRTKTGATLIPRAQWQDMGWYAKNAEKFKSGEYVRDYEH